jgi:Secretion system C-terminal sorting domain
MKNIILIAFTLLGVVPVMAQQDNFYTTLWKVKEYHSVFRTDKTLYYHKDSINNSLDFSKAEFVFSANGTYAGKNNDGDLSSGTCVFSVTQDSVTIDEGQYKVVLLDENTFTSLGYSLEYYDNEGSEDTSFNYLTLYRVSVVTSNTNDDYTNSYVNVFPNPITNQLTVESMEANVSIKEVRVFTPQGTPLSLTIVIQPSKTVINTSAWPTGLYVIEIIDQSGKKITRKITKQ